LLIAAVKIVTYWKVRYVWYCRCDTILFLSHFDCEFAWISIGDSVSELSNLDQWQGSKKKSETSNQTFVKENLDCKLIKESIDQSLSAFLGIINEKQSYSIDSLICAAHTYDVTNRTMYFCSSLFLKFSFSRYRIAFFAI